MKNKRRIELAVISDVHLGTYGCHAKELLKYLKSINPRTLILNGDIIDIWQFKKYYWPKSHMKVAKYLMELATKGTHVYYVTGNHDETLRKFSGLKMGGFEIVNNISLELDGKKVWFFHGDVFDVIMKHSKWLAKIGSVSYDLLILLNLFINHISKLFGRGNVSLSKKIKDNVKSALKYINNFEITAATLAIQKGYDYIVCGHIHQPEMREIHDHKGNSIFYLNSGDWIENLTSLEYTNGKWKLYYYRQDDILNSSDIEEPLTALTDLNNKELFKIMVNEFQS